MCVQRNLNDNRQIVSGWAINCSKSCNIRSSIKIQYKIHLDQWVMRALALLSLSWPQVLSIGDLFIVISFLLDLISKAWLHHILAYWTLIVLLLWNWGLAVVQATSLIYSEQITWSSTDQQFTHLIHIIFDHNNNHPQRRYIQLLHFSCSSPQEITPKCFRKATKMALLDKIPQVNTPIQWIESINNIFNQKHDLFQSKAWSQL